MFNSSFPMESSHITQHWSNIIRLNTASICCSLIYMYLFPYCLFISLLFNISVPSLSQVAMAPSDHFNPFPIDQDYSDLLSINQSNMSPLTEDTCLVLPSIHVSSFSSPTSSSSISYAPFVMVLDAIVRAEFSITNLQLVRLSSNMVEEVCSCMDTQLKVCMGTYF